MKGWHLEHAEKAIVRFAVGLSEDASEFEKRNYRKYGTVAGCIRQIGYDMHHGVQKREIMEIIRKIRRNKKYAKIRSNPEAMMRLEELKDKLSGISKEEERHAWHRHAYREKVKNVI
ncbi:MAG: hypothetical protein ACRD4B_00570 [Acidobacteriota bacterium]